MNLNSLSLGDLNLLRDTLDTVEPLMRLTGATLDLTATEPKIALPMFKAGLPGGFKINQPVPIPFEPVRIEKLLVGEDGPEIDAPKPSGKVVEPEPKEPAKRGAKNIGATWSDTEDDLLVVLRVEMADKSFYACAYEAQKRLAAAGFQRTTDAIAYRIKSVLRDRITAAMPKFAPVAEPEPTQQAEEAPEAELPAEQPASEPEAVDIGIPTSESPKQFTAPLEDDLPIWQRHLRGALNHLGYANDWTPADDLRLVEMIGQGWKIGTAADALERDHASVNARWQALATVARDGKDRLGIDDLKHLAIEVRARAAMAGA